MRISKYELEKLYRKKLNRELCLELGITGPTLISLLKKNNIPLKGQGNPYSVGRKKKIEVY